MLGTVRRKTEINVQRNRIVPTVLHLVSMLEIVRRKCRNVQKDVMVNSQHAWYNEKEKQELTCRGILWSKQRSTAIATLNMLVTVRRKSTN